MKLSARVEYVPECKGCGRHIVRAKNFSTGRYVTLEACDHVYRLLEGETEDPDKENIMVEQVKEDQVYIPHFLTCHQATELSSPKKGV